MGPKHLLALSFLALAVLVPMGFTWPSPVGFSQDRSSHAASSVEGGGSFPSHLAPPRIHDNHEVPTGENEPPATLASIVGTRGMSGWYVSPVTIEMEAKDEDPGSVSIAYRTAGGPWQDYTGPLTLSEDGVHSLEFFARDALGAAEALRTWEIKIDATPPETTLLLDGVVGEGGWYTSSVMAWPMPVDQTSGVRNLFIRVDGGPWGDFPPPLLFRSDGEHNLEFFATDIAGNSEFPSSRQIRLDMEAPHVAIKQPANGDILQASTLDVVWSARDGTSGIGSCWATLDGEVLPMEASAPLRVQDLSDGTHEIRLACLDAAGNRGEALVTFLVSTSTRSPSGPLGPVVLLASILVSAVGVALMLILKRGRKARRGT